MVDNFCRRNCVCGFLTRVVCCFQLSLCKDFNNVTSKNFLFQLLPGLLLIAGVTTQRVAHFQTVLGDPNTDTTLTLVSSVESADWSVSVSENSVLSSVTNEIRLDLNDLVDTFNFEILNGTLSENEVFGQINIASGVLSPGEYLVDSLSVTNED